MTRHVAPANEVIHGQGASYSPKPGESGGNDGTTDSHSIVCIHQGTPTAALVCGHHSANKHTTMVGLLHGRQGAVIVGPLISGQWR
jgi:hypothetical protein